VAPNVWFAGLQFGHVSRISHCAAPPPEKSCAGPKAVDEMSEILKPRPFCPLIAYLFALMAFGGCGVTLADEPAMPTQVLVSIKQCMEAASTLFHAVDSQESRQTAFRDSLVEIANGLDARTAAACKENEGDSIQCKVACIAVDFRARPNLYQEVYRGYLAAPVPSGNISVAGPQFPSLDRALVNEGYRWVWEYMLLWPEQGGINFRSLGDFHEKIVLAALKEINSAKSQILYEYCFTESAKSDIYGRKWTSESTPWNGLLDAMALQQTPDSIQKMLRCLDSVKGNPKFYAKARQRVLGHLIGIDSEWIDDYFRGFAPKRVLKYSEWRPRRETWAKAIKQVPIESVQPEGRVVLKQALEYPQY
jgi:hypothetical protein